MKNKLKYIVSIIDYSNDWVFSRVVSSRSASEAVSSVVLTFQLSVSSDVFSRLKDCDISVRSCVC